MKTDADCADPVAELERFCAQLGHELETVQRERTRLWEENQRLRAAMQSVEANTTNDIFVDPQKREMYLSVIRAALGNK